MARSSGRTRASRSIISRWTRPRATSSAKVAEWCGISRSSNLSSTGFSGPTLHEGRCTVRTLMSVTFGVCLLAVSTWSVGLAGQANMVQTHIGHVLDSFNGTPMNMGLLPTAMAEAKTAATHAGLAAKSTTLAMIQTHAGHVINTIDPTIVAQGPGMGYG